MNRTLLTPLDLRVHDCEVLSTSDDPFKPHIHYYPKLKTWRLEKHFHYERKDLEVHIDLTAPFDYDMASIPRGLWTFIGPHELGIIGPLVHDWLYRSGGSAFFSGRSYTRKEADQLFLLDMEDSGVGKAKRKAAYQAVRLFGGGSWRKADLS
jgi:hypothetical protein